MRQYIHIWRKAILLILLAVSVAQAFGQPPFVFHHLTTKDGLSNGSVSAFLKDSYGFLWIGTQYGLNRYDGYEFKIYTTRPGSANTMLANNIMGLQEDGLGNIWISSLDYMIYNRKKDNFITDVPKFLEGIGISISDNYRIYVDNKKDLWVLSAQKVYFYCTREEVLTTFNIELQIDELEAIELTDDEEHLYGILKPGYLWRINKRSGKQEMEKLPSSLNPNTLNRVYTDSRGGLWLWSNITESILYRDRHAAVWNRLVLSPIARTEPNRILDLLDDENGHIWIGTDHNGLFVYDIASGAVTNLLADHNSNSSIASNNIGCIYRDDDGIIWMGHNKKGVSFYHYSFHNIVNIEHPECRDVSVFLEDMKGRVWLGTDGNGLFLKGSERGKKIKQTQIGNSPIVSLLEDRKGRIWIGTYLDGLYCYDNGKYQHFTKENSRLASNDIWCLKEDRYGNLWIGSLDGAIQCLRGGMESLSSLETLCQDVKHPLDMYYDGGDKLYIATVYGLYVVDIKTNNCTGLFGNRLGTQSFKQNLITYLFIDSRSNIWMGHTEGLSVWDMKKDSIYYIDKESGLRDNLISGIVEDDHRNVWVSTSNGLSVLFPELDNQGFMSFSCKNFTTKDGLIDNYFNSHAIYKLRNGDILLGGTEGYSIINPNKMLERNEFSAHVIFTGLVVGNSRVQVDSTYNGRLMLNSSLEHTQSLTFSHSDKPISLHFTTGDLLYADKVKYAYKLEGFHSQWQTTHENRIVFSFLAPGEYMLYVKACNSDGVWSDQVSNMTITVLPPLYLTIWAKLLYLLTIIGLISYGIHKILRRKILKFEQQRIQKEREQKAYLDEMKLRFFTNVSHDLRTPLTLIISPLQAILNGCIEDGVRKKIETISKSAEELLRLINSLLDFRKLDVGAEILRLKSGDLAAVIKEICLPFYTYAIDRNITFSVDDELEICLAEFDHDKVGKIILNLLSNAFKFTPDGGIINVRIYKEDNLICVAVSDSGFGIRETDKPHVFKRFYQTSKEIEQTGSGIGLHIASEYIRMHSGTITVEDNTPKGSIFRIKLPLVNTETYDEFSDEDEDEEIEDVFYENEKIALPTRPVLLFVDDNKDLCEFMADSMSDEFSVLVAFNGQEALDQLQSNDVNIVVSDVMMPVMSGTELCKQIKTNIQWSHIPVILLTARASEEYQIEGLKLGADDYLTKPFNFNLLKLRIRKFLEWTEKCHQTFSQKLDVSPSEITITSLDEKLISKAISVVEEHIADTDFSVEELSLAVGLSRGYLYKKLISITGKGPAEFIRTIRLKRGLQLLEKSQMQVAEIAYAVGFNTPKRFSINFKQEFGISPSDYMRKNK